MTQEKQLNPCFLSSFLFLIPSWYAFFLGKYWLGVIFQLLMITSVGLHSKFKNDYIRMVFEVLDRFIAILISVTLLIHCYIKLDYLYICFILGCFVLLVYMINVRYGKHKFRKLIHSTILHGVASIGFVYYVKMLQ
jgi:hypothetical protein